MKIVQSAVLTESPEFRRWFRDSKVVDNQGKPLVVYHGSSAKFTSFSPNSWFTDNPTQAEIFYKGRHGKNRAGGVTYPVYLSIQKPLVVDADVHDGTNIDRFLRALGINWDEWRKRMTELRMPEVREYWETNQGQDNEDKAPILNEWGWLFTRTAKEEPFTVVRRNTELQWYAILESSTVQLVLKDLGFDGVATREKMKGVEGNTWMIFDPKQAKSAIGNTTFSPEHEHLNK